MVDRTLGNRIATLRKSKGLSQDAVATAIGVSSPAVTNWEKDAYKPKADPLQALAILFGVTVQYLLEGGDDPFANNPNQVIPDHSIQVPILSWQQAHSFTNFSSVDLKQIEGWIPLSRIKADGLFFIKAQGIINNPTFIEGDFILVDSNFSDFKSGDIVLAKQKGYAVIGKYIVETNGVKSLQALNPDYHPNITTLDDSHIIIGLVIQSLRYTYTSHRH